MHKLGYMTAVGALLLALTACSGAGEPEANAGTAEATPITSAEPTTDAPLTAETPDATTAEDARYLEAMRRITALPETEDTKLLEVGAWTCSELDAGKQPADITVIDGADKAANAEAVFVAVDIYCPTYRDAAQQWIWDATS